MTPGDGNPDRAAAQQAEAMTDERRAELSKPLKGWIRLEGQTLRPLDGQEYAFSATDRGPGEGPGTFGSNNGRLVAIDGDGNHWISPHSETRVQELKAVGYSAEPLSVPLSNGERFADDALNRRMDRLDEDAAAERQLEGRRTKEARHRAAAKKMGITEVDGQWYAD